MGVIKSLGRLGLAGLLVLGHGIGQASSVFAVMRVAPVAAVSGRLPAGIPVVSSPVVPLGAQAGWSPAAMDLVGQSGIRFNGILVPRTPAIAPLKTVRSSRV